MKDSGLKKLAIFSLCVCLLFGMAAAAGFYAAYLQKNRFEAEMALQKDMLQQTQARLEGVVAQTAEMGVSYQKTLDELAMRTKNMSRQTDDLRRKSLLQSADIGRLVDVAFSDLASTALLLDAITAPTGAERAPVSFETVRIPPYLLKHRPPIHGTDKRDEYVLQTEEKLVIDAASLYQIEKIHVQNGKSNEIVIAAPGLKSLADDWLEIVADPDLDRVYLDGCLSWHKSGVEKGIETWVAIDTHHVTRKVTMNEGMPVEKTSCDNRYVVQRAILDLPEVWFRRTANAHDWLDALRKRREAPQMMEAGQLFSYWRKNLFSDGAHEAFSVISSFSDMYRCRPSFFSN